ncbi:MAG: hypothetical protein H6973_01530 [Gammaproteobacteria bacterium]|nr:hypothetical protein [Gammaproteobacteria bacterium]
MNKRIEIALGLLLLTLLPVVAAGTCLSTIQSTTSTEDFILDDLNGTATHAKTGMTWMRCSLGQTWESATQTCSGTATGYTWGEALRAA